jgi:phosphatidate cytidylyltransferase
MLKKRLITALCGIPVIILAVWFSEPEYTFPLLTVLAAVWGVLAVYEFYRITGVSKNLPLTIFGLIWTVLFIIQPHFRDTLSPSFLVGSGPFLLTSGLIISLIMLIFLPVKEGVFHQWVWTMAGILYVGWLLGLLVFLRLEGGPELGRNLLYMVLFVTFASDTAAYFFGKAFGRHKLAPAISPGKTWEGSIAGVIGAVIIGIFFTLQTPVKVSLSFGEIIILAILISVFGQLGDLAESLLKRNTGVKDSGNLMPGHGGLLDRMDSIVFAGAIMYLFYVIRIIGTT